MRAISGRPRLLVSAGPIVPGRCVVLFFFFYCYVHDRCPNAVCVMADKGAFVWQAATVRK